MFRADGERRSFSVVRDVTVLGRREDCDLRIPLGDVSRKHCRIIRNGDSVRIEDLGSSNGTLCNGERVTTAQLQPGDTVALGPVTFVVQINGFPADEELMPYAHNREPVAQDTAIAAAAVGVGSMTEVEPPPVPEGEEEIAELDELEEDFGAAPLIASADDGDDDDAVSALDPIADLDSSGELQPVDAETIQEIEEIDELEEVEEIAELEPVAERVPANEESGLQPIDDLAHLEKVTDPEPAPAPVKAHGRPAKPAAAVVVVAAMAPVPAMPKPPKPAKAKAPAKEPEPPVDAPIEGELQESDVFEGMSGSNFEIVVDDAAENSSSGEIEVDWNAESNSGSK